MEMCFGGHSLKIDVDPPDPVTSCNVSIHLANDKPGTPEIKSIE